MIRQSISTSKKMVLNNLKREKTVWNGPRQRVIYVEFDCEKTTARIRTIPKPGADLDQTRPDPMWTRTGASPI